MTFNGKAHAFLPGGEARMTRRNILLGAASLVGVGVIAVGISLAAAGGDAAVTVAGDTPSPSSSAAFECPPGVDIITSELSFSDAGVAAWPDSAEGALVKSALDTAKQHPNTIVKSKDAKPENFKKAKKNQSESDTGAGRYIMNTNGQVVAEFTVEESASGNRSKFYVNKIEMCNY